jgi:hypothetical protein
MVHDSVETRRFYAKIAAGVIVRCNSIDDDPHA